MLSSLGGKGSVEARELARPVPAPQQFFVEPTHGNGRPRPRQHCRTRGFMKIAARIASVTGIGQHRGLGKTDLGARILAPRGTEERDGTGRAAVDHRQPRPQLEKILTTPVFASQAWISRHAVDEQTDRTAVEPPTGGTAKLRDVA